MPYIWLFAFVLVACVGAMAVGRYVRNELAAAFARREQERDSAARNALALREAEERMRFALQAARIGVWEMNLKNRVVHVSEICRSILDLPEGFVEGPADVVLSCVHPEDQQEARDTVARAIREHADAELELRVLARDGSVRRVATFGRYTYDDDGTPVRGAGVTIDVTERSSLEAQLRQAQKMEAVGQLAGGIAHDFNNLLTAIQGYAELVSDSLDEADERRGSVEEIRRAADRATKLTRQLLAFSRKQMLTLKPVHLGDIVSEITPMLRRLLGETIDLKTIAGDSGRVKADVAQIEQVLVNLAVNARDAMPDGGRLTIETADIVLDEAYARRHPTMRSGPHVLLTVSDSGHGMDAEAQKHAFEPFFTTKPKGQGTGLGLATVYGIVKQSGGHIWVYSEVGVGTTFKVYLPRTDEAAVRDARRAERRPMPGHETILLVEDEQVVREYASTVLGRLGYTVHSLPDPTRAIAFAREFADRIDVVLTDVVLPGMSGPAMIAELRDSHPDAKVLYMSGYTDNAIVRHGVLDGGVCFLQKPFSGDALGRKLRDLIDGRVPAGAAKMATMEEPSLP